MPEAVLRDAPPLRRSICTRSRCDHRNVILCGPSSSSCDEDRMKRREFISLFGSGVEAARVESTAAEESRAASSSSQRIAQATTCACVEQRRRNRLGLQAGVRLAEEYQLRHIEGGMHDDSNST